MSIKLKSLVEGLFIQDTPGNAELYSSFKKSIKEHRGGELAIVENTWNKMNDQQRSSLTFAAQNNKVELKYVSEAVTGKCSQCAKPATKKCDGCEKSVCETHWDEALGMCWKCGDGYNANESKLTEGTSMTRQHFQFIADTIKSLGGLDSNDKDYVASRFAQALQQTNPGFDLSRFLKACRG